MKHQAEADELRNDIQEVVRMLESAEEPALVKHMIPSQHKLDRPERPQGPHDQDQDYYGENIQEQTEEEDVIDHKTVSEALNQSGKVVDDMCQGQCSCDTCTILDGTGGL